MGEARTFIELKGIEKVFPGVKALDGVSFDIREGEVHSLCGENGAGKSTLIKVMTGAHARDGGQYLIDGKEVQFRSTQEAIAAGVSCVYQELSIAPQLDVAKNLFIGNLPVKGGLVDHKSLYEKARQILAELDLNISPRTIAGDLSVGQQQMIEIGRALTRNARLPSPEARQRPARSVRFLWRCCLYPAFPLSPKRDRQYMSCPRCPASRSSVRGWNGQEAAHRAALRYATSPFSAENRDRAENGAIWCRL